MEPSVALRIASALERIAEVLQKIDDEGLVVLGFDEIEDSIDAIAKVLRGHSS